MIKHINFTESRLDGIRQLATITDPDVTNIVLNFKNKSKLLCKIWGDQEGLFKLVMLNFIFKWYNWSNFRLLTASH
jgi:hypothetical protein